ncbi:MAG: hypothetical protein HY834_03870 [Devosia nanyangense]|uniref:DUF2188 domain-containing protein n=1 Tax=Devosia nanyangense TaxID=1228055 RepID=A0A933L0H7_9HYPH|nr:hypothetical protein [Devosia nanyangense]
MTTAIFIVIFARKKWWIDLNGHTQGPFLSKDSALAEATKHAKDLARAGHRSEVQLSEPGERSHIVYQSAEQGFLGRAAALVDH